MLIRSIRRNSLSKYLLLCGITVCFIFYIKFLNNNSNSGNNINSNDINSDALVGDSDTSKININYEKSIQRDLAKQVPKLGDNGEAVTLEGSAKELGDKFLATIALNEELSEQLSYNRTTPDARNPLCRDLTYDIDSLPTTSVVIIFFNEPYSVLLRTVHSVINTVPKKLLKEIILVDDASVNVELIGKLDYYIETRLPKNIVKVLRLKNR